MKVSLFYVHQNKTKNADAFEKHFLKKIKKNMSLQIIGIAIKKKFSSKEQQIKYECERIKEKIGKEKYICFDKALIFIQPILPLLDEELDTLNFDAVFSNPFLFISSIIFEIFTFVNFLSLFTN